MRALLKKEACGAHGDRSFSVCVCVCDVRACISAKGCPREGGRGERKERSETNERQAERTGERRTKGRREQRQQRAGNY